MPGQIYVFVLMLALLSGCATAPSGGSAREPSNLGGPGFGNAYNRGTYDCADERNGVSSQFSFKSSSATFDLKGEKIELSCVSAAEADADLVEALGNAAVRFVDLCEGESKKGTVVAGTSNSMGAVQMTAILMGKAKKVTARSVLNCTGARRDGGGW